MTPARSPAKPLLTLCMIVKDEAATLERTLRSVKPHVDRYVIMDTGSSDGTQALVRRVMDGVPGEIPEVPFVDFATTRNAALDACGEHSEFILWLDADDLLEGGPALRTFLEKRRNERGPEHEAYYLRVLAGIHFDSARVLRSAARWRFEGVVHEVLTCPGRPPPVHRAPDVLVRHDATGVSVERSRRRWERDVGLLGAALEKDPTSTRTAFYLALTLRWLGRNEEAMVALRRRIELGGWREEVFHSMLELGHAARDLGRPWPEVLALYLDAHAYSPHRAEPLHAIALHYDREGQHALTLLFARRGYELPLPASDRLFVDEDIYRHGMADLVGTSAYWVGEYALGEEALRKALRFRPDDTRLRKNLEFYLAKRKKKG